MTEVGFDADERMRNAQVSADALTVGLMDDHSISVPLARFPRLLDCHARATCALIAGRRRSSRPLTEA